MKEKFEHDIKKRQAVLQRQYKIDNYIGIIKLLWSIIIGYGCYLIYNGTKEIKFLLGIAFELIIFVIICRIHRNIKRRIKFEEGIIQIDQINMKRITGEWVSFLDGGQEYVCDDHPYASDLDIVGSKSLFQLLNSTHTNLGRERFAKDLLEAEYIESEIKERQDAVSELSDDYEFSSKIEYVLSEIPRDPILSQFREQVKHKREFISNQWIVGILKSLWIPACTLLVLAVISKNEVILQASFVCIGINLVIWLLYLMRARRYIGCMYKMPSNLMHYDIIANEIIEKDYTSVKLNQIKETMKEALKAFCSLAKISDNIAQGHNAVAYFILNTLFLWDIRNAIALDDWTQRYSSNFEEWLEYLGEFESLLSFANFPRICNNTAIPLFGKAEKKILAKEMGHPFIDSDKRVCNDFSLDHNIYIVSGSNMSGKTTFMRTVGINLVLARAGSFVCAKYMVFSDLKLVTSMRIADDVNEGISTFYAEIMRIKRIVDMARVNQNTIFLIDEIFRGTNSVDRLTGAKEVLRELMKANVVGMITTHDLEVCNLEKENSHIRNYSFLEHYENGEMVFDYKLKKGRTKTTNAIYLLKKIGILV